MKTLKFNNKRAFTLIELLIVIAIIGILFIVLVSKVDFATDKARATGVQTDFRSFQMAFETVSRENAGFNTFGWDTGDLNANGKKDVYDQGDNGAGGGIAHNGIQDGTEVFTGRKTNGETFTSAFTLIKPGTDFSTVGYDSDAIAKLETAINANLDPKLHITIDHMTGDITMANGAQDPWKNPYHGQYISAEDGMDRGAIVIYSDGPNGVNGSEHVVRNGVATISIPGNNKDGKDDYGMVVVYSIVNSYGRVDVTTTGFSNNQSPENHNGNNVVVDDNNGNIDVPDVDPEVMAPVTLGNDKVIYVNNVDFEYYEVYFSVYRNDELIDVRNLDANEKTLDVHDLMLRNGNYRIECEFLGELADDVRGHYTCESKYFKAWNVSDSVIAMNIVFNLESGSIYSDRYAFYEVRDEQNNVVGTFDDCNVFMISQLDTAKTYSIYKDSGEFIGYIIYE